MVSWSSVRWGKWLLAFGIAGLLGCVPAASSVGKQQTVSYGRVSARGSGLQFQRFRNVLPGGIPVSVTAASDDKLAVGYLGGTLAICSIEEGPIDAILPPWRMIRDPGRAAVIAKVQALATDGEGKAVLALSVGGEAWYWDIDRGKATELQPHYDGLVSVAIDRSGRFVAAAALSGQLVLWDLEAEKAVASSIAEGARVTALSFVDHSRILVCEEDGRLSVWRPGNALERKLTLPHGVVRAWRGTGEELALSDGDGRISLVTIGDAGPVHVGHWGLPAVPLDLVKSGDTWYAAGWTQRSEDGKAIAIYRLARGRQVQKVTDLELRDAGYKAAAFLKQGKAVAVARADGVIEVFETTSGKLSSTLRPDLDAPLAVAPGKDGVLGVVYRRSLGLWDLRKGEIVHRQSVAVRDSMPDACLVPGGHSRLLVADGDRLISWDLVTSRVTSTNLWADSNAVHTRIATDVAGQFLLSWSFGQDRGLVALWAFRDGEWRELKRTRLDHATGTLAPSGTAALVAGFDGRYTVWPLRRLDLPRRGELAREAPVFVQFVDGHSKLLSVHLDTSVCLLDLGSGRLVKELRMRPEFSAASQAVMWASAAPGGDHVVAVCMDGRVYVTRLHGKMSVWELLPAGFTYPLSPVIDATGFCYLITENGIEVWRLGPAEPTFSGFLLSLRRSSESDFLRAASQN